MGSDSNLRLDDKSNFALEGSLALIKTLSILLIVLDSCLLVFTNLVLSDLLFKDLIVEFVRVSLSEIVIELSIVGLDDV